MDFAFWLKFLTNRSELKGGFLLLGFVLPILNFFGLLFMFCLGFKLLQLTWQGKGLIQFLSEIGRKLSNPNCGYSSKKGFDNACESKMVSYKSKPLISLENSKSANKGKSMVTEEPVYQNADSVDEDENYYGRETCFEDDEFDVIELRRLVKIERHRAEMAYAELEKERMASASAADETMAMILRLQNEKSSMEIEAKQYRRAEEQQQEHYQEVIQSFQWIIMKHESEKSVLEEKLRLCERKLQQGVKEDEMDQF